MLEGLQIYIIGNELMFQQLIYSQRGYSNEVAVNAFYPLNIYSTLWRRIKVESVLIQYCGPAGLLSAILT